MHAKFYIPEDKFEEVLQRVTGVADFKLYLKIARPDENIQVFSAVDEVLKYKHSIAKAGCFKFGLAMHLEESKGFVLIDRIEFDEKQTGNGTFQESALGWGIFSLQFQTPPKTEGIVECCLFCESEESANRWFDTYPDMKSPDLWDWELIDSVGKKLQTLAKEYVKKTPKRFKRIIKKIKEESKVKEQSGPFICYTVALMIAFYREKWDKLFLKRSLFRLEVSIPWNSGLTPVPSNFVRMAQPTECLEKRIVLNMNSFLPDNRLWALIIWLNPKGVFNRICYMGRLKKGQNSGVIKLKIGGVDVDMALTKHNSKELTIEIINKDELSRKDSQDGVPPTTDLGGSKNAIYNLQPGQD